MTYWPWWLGSIALACVTVLHWWVTRRPFAVSGSLARAIAWKRERALDASEGADDPAALAAAMHAATVEEFGAAAAGEMDPSAPSPAIFPVPRVRWSAQLTFLALIPVGGLIAALTHGGLALHSDLGTSFARLFGDGWSAAAILLGGGLLVGIGTRMAGGCTSGHGLSGCARLQPGSMIATASFFGTAIAVSLLLERVLS